MTDLHDVLTERDKQVFAQSGYGKRMGFGNRPAILVIDVNYNFVGDKPEPILESIKKWRNSCGDEGWEGVNRIKELLTEARDKNIPIIYSTGQEPRKDGFDSGRWADKNSRRSEDRSQSEVNGNTIVPVIEPEPHDIVITKGKPSVFFGTLLLSYLTDLQVDSLIVCGTTTSGCVRATVIDAFSYNFKVSIVEECTFDRGQTTHKINLFDMNQKYADVIELNEAVTYLRSCSKGLFAEKMPALKAIK
ncbi:isochorismatase family protein [Mesobacillus harenae]|uniref:isochorismatase family protein n=1 Tax=Mesobacillus harenae TaxID=2213203 RepID=UPI001580BF7F|nr:isochorismatase family protein [Mesobacillus harenae]